MKRFGILIASAVVIAALSVQAAEPKGEINKRKENQQDRIAQGVNSGELTAAEAAKLENKEARVNREIRHDRKKNGWPSRTARFSKHFLQFAFFLASE
jgi:hypothetical protein